MYIVCVSWVSAPCGEERRGLGISHFVTLQSVGYTGLEIFALDVVRFPAGVRVPQQGWNKVSVDPRCRILKSGFAYFSNSFCLRGTPAGWHSCGWVYWCVFNGAESQHGIPFVSAVERGRVVGAQFHPELSGTLGLGILKARLAQLFLLLQRWIASFGDVTFDLPTQAASTLCRRVIPVCFPSPPCHASVFPVRILDVCIGE